LTSLTPTGRARASQIKHERVFYCHLPYDLSLLLSGFIRRVNPKFLIIMETELWPNLLATCYHKKIPVLLANARMSERSAKGYGRIQSLTRQMLKQISCVAVQNEIDGNRFIKLGLPQENMIITGSIKFDLTLAANIKEKAAQLRKMWENRPVWIAASTHPQEEEQILLAHKQILSAIPEALLILVPRHPERFINAKALAEQLSFHIVTRSSGEQCHANTNLFLGDTMGELLVYYGAADVAFVGGSLVATGGHNPLEPAALSLPIITGPHVFNFAQICRLLIKAGAQQQVKDSQELALIIIKLLTDTKLRLTMGQQAEKMLNDNRGALNRLLEIIKAQYVQ